MSLLSTHLLAQAPEVNQGMILHDGTSRRLKNELINWQAAVEAYILVCGVIIIDRRADTLAVQEEIELISSNNLQYKTICVFSSEPSTQRCNGQLLNAGDLAVDIVRLEVILKEICRDAEKVPKPDNSLAQIFPNDAPARNGDFFLDAET